MDDYLERGMRDYFEVMEMFYSFFWAVDSQLFITHRKVNVRSVYFKNMFVLISERKTGGEREKERPQ